MEKNNKQMKIGFYVAYPPQHVNASLKQEGLGRYMSMLIKAFANKGYIISIACPSWNVPLVDELIDDLGIDRNCVEYVTRGKMPIALRLYYVLINRGHTRKRKKRKLIKAAMKFGMRFVDFAFSIRQIFAFVLFSIICLLGTILLLPIALIGGVVYQIIKLIKKICFKVRNRGQEKVKESLQEGIVAQMKDYLFNVYFSGYIEKVRLTYGQEVVYKINKMSSQADIWYCPTAFWNEFNQIKGKKVMCAPDMVTTEFPVNFAVANMAKKTDDVRKALKNGTYFITYCEYVKKTLLEDKLMKKEDNIIAIQHGVNDCLKAIDVTSHYVNIGYQGDAVEKFCRSRLHELLPYAVSEKRYLSSKPTQYDFTSFNYIFYASQARGSKNILNLVKAYEILLREKHIPYKLVLTCCYTGDYVLNKYIKEHRLQYDILAFQSVSNQKLAMLYKCATLCVNPTFYEGGFPFTFSEGMSVGTPSVMSRIPQVLEVVDEKKWDKMLFDPYDYHDMADKIEECLNSLNEVYEVENELYKKMKERTWEEVAQEYVEAFEYFIEKDVV